MKKHYSIDIERFFGQNETLKLERAAFNKGMGYTINHNGYKAQIYVLELGKVLTSDKVPVFKSEETFNGIKLAPLYIEGYKQGREYFKNEYGVSPDTLFGNAESYVKNLHYLYFHKEPVTGKNGWIYYRNTYPFLFTEDKITNYGFAAGVFFEIEELKKKYPYLFRDFETLFGLSEIEKKGKDTKQGRGKKTVPVRFEELFYDEDAVSSFVDVLRQIESPAVDDEGNYIGKNKGVICVWIDELQRQGIVKRYSDRTIYPSLIPQRISGLKIDESMFGKHHKKAENLYRTDIKALVSNVKLSQNSQKGKLGK
jgi:hypothetical protein